jgi:DNA-binding NarL/FixJ family response regulator
VEATPAVLRVLVADDFSAWRAAVREILQARPEWQIVCEVCDGGQAVQEATTHQPDIVLLDIGMPGMNGITAAKKIRDVSPGSIILFLTQNLDRGLMNEAFALGAEGYVLKTRAWNDLPAAIERCALRRRAAARQTL